ncbi:hypothetical protein EJ110_NYTH32406 [Nymphaea thermarum]|nr:hypothetical protein EJ110_NYTH32406 [Nymphaea thermarum]
MKDGDQDWALWVDETRIGYWPKSNYRARNANKVTWGGEIVNRRTQGRHTSTQMGNGHFPSEPIGKVAYISNMALYDLHKNLYDVPAQISVYVNNPNCYDIRYWRSDSPYGRYITFGGPGYDSVDDGDIYDCMKLDSQPRKRNPSIIRKMQSREKPSLHGTRTTANNSDNESTRNKPRKSGALEKGSCPLGSFPVLKATKAGPLNFSAIESFASLRARSFHNSKTTKPLDNIPPSRHENDGYKTWLYNDDRRRPRNNHLQFRRLDSYMPSGKQLDCSTIGEDNTELEIIIKQDEDQDWEVWVDETMIGFWPKSNYRALNANKIEWGGEIVNKWTRGRHTSTQMGNGHFSSEPIGRVAYISNMALYDLDLDRYLAPEAVNVYVPQADCYDLKYSPSDDEYGRHITFGGPGTCSRSNIIERRSRSVQSYLLSKGSRHLLEVEKYYRKQVPIKTITVDDGDVYDCMKLDSQPRKRNPSILRKIQSREKPSLHGTITTANSSEHESRRNGRRKAGAFRKVSCPPGSFPVLKATKAGPLNFSAIESFASLRARSFLKSTTTKPLFDDDDDDDPPSTHEYATASVRGGSYAGAEGTLSIWRPTLEDDREMSLSQIWVVSETADDISMSLEAGWMINPSLYGDRRTRLRPHAHTFVLTKQSKPCIDPCFPILSSKPLQMPVPPIDDHGTIEPPARSRFNPLPSDVPPLSSLSPLYNDNYKTCLYNDNCRRPRNNRLQFTRLDSYMPSGKQLDCSTIGGDNTELEIIIKQDEDQDWELWVDETMIGFWPKSNYRARKANKIVWGGEIVNTQTRGRHTSTQMGNGHFSSEPIGRVAYISNMALYNLDLDRYLAPEAINVCVPQADCYDLKYYLSDDEYGRHITFGGPAVEFHSLDALSPHARHPPPLDALPPHFLLPPAAPPRLTLSPSHCRLPFDANYTSSQQRPSESRLKGLALSQPPFFRPITSVLPFAAPNWEKSQPSDHAGVFSTP